MSRYLSRVAIILPLTFAAAQAQTTVSTSPTALTLASASLQAEVGSTTLTDATLQGTVNYTAGSDEESGTFTLEAKGNQESKLVLALTGGQREEIRQGQLGAWVDTEGVEHAMALHNCWVDASVLFPTFSVWGALNDPQVTATYVERTYWNGTLVDHLQLSRLIPGQSAAMTAEIQGLSAMNLYLDAATHLPVGLGYMAHPSDDFSRSFPVEIHFSGYQKLDGILVPTHIQKLIQGTLTLDFYVSDVTVNSGLSDTEFTVQASQGVN